MIFRTFIYLLAVNIILRALLRYTYIMKDSNLLREIEPSLEQAYDEHMQSIASKQDGLPDKRPFSPMEQLARSANTGPDPLEYGVVLREDYNAHVSVFAEKYAIDIRAIMGASFLVNLLTEDNLPHYTSRIHSKVHESPALSAFANEWTAEEDTHGVIMRDYALLSGMIGENELSAISQSSYHQGRVQQLRTGTEIDPQDLQVAFSYLTLQEHLTKEAHKKEGWILPPTGRKIMNPVAGDEQNHYEFYRKASQASLDVDPDGTLTAMNRVYKEFSMPGRLGIPNFDKLALIIGLSGIFDLETIAQSMQTFAKKLNIANATPKTDEGKDAKESLLARTSNEAVSEQRILMESLRDQQPTSTYNGLAPFVLGKTVEYTYKGHSNHKRPTGIIPIRTRQ